MDEVQSITCTCPSACTGNVILAMEESRTGWIAASADASTVETALEAVPTIDGVTLSMNDSALCTTGGTLTQVTFTHQPGDLPLLRLLASSLASDTTLTFAEGTCWLKGGGRYSLRHTPFLAQTASHERHAREGALLQSRHV